MPSSQRLILIVEVVSRRPGEPSKAIRNAFSGAFVRREALLFELRPAEQPRTAVAGFIDEHNNDRRHSTAGRLPPAVYEARIRTERAA